MYRVLNRVNILANMMKLLRNVLGWMNSKKRWYEMLENLEGGSMKSPKISGYGKDNVISKRIGLSI